jgi:hypothetical protein
MKTNFLILFCIILFSCAKDQKKENIVKETPLKVTLVPNQDPEEVEEKENKLIFTVQIAALKKANETLTNLENINIFKEGILVKYRIGAFDTYKESRVERAMLIKKYKGAFVQALLNDTPISITEALQY